MKIIHSVLHKLYCPDVAKLFIRVALGIVFINAGWMKIQNIDMVLQGFASIGIPAWLTYVVSYGEFIAGILIIAGLFARYAAIFISIDMIVATLKVHLSNGFSIANGGYEYTLVLLLIALSVLMQGGGKHSIARLIFKKHYACAGVCGGVSKEMGVCKDSNCTHYNKDMKECNCDDRSHTEGRRS